MESTSILHYLLDIIEEKQISPVAKLASLTILNKLCWKEANSLTKLTSLKSNLMTSLLTLLDSGLCEFPDPLYKVIIAISMEMIFQISRLPVGSIQCLITESVIRTLLEYLNSNGKFRQFPSNTTDILSKVIEGKQVMGKVRVVSMATEPLDYIHRHTKNKLRRVPDKVRVCRLINTELEEDVDVTQHLIDSHVAWPGAFPGEVKSPYDADWQNILVTQVLDGGMFWAQVGEKAIKNVIDIQRQLNNVEKHVSKPRALIGDFVVAYSEILDNPCYLRAQVLSFEGSQVDVFAIDYGYTLRVSDRHVYVLPEELSPSKVKRRVSLCAVDGISPPVFDETLCHNAAAILVNLCKQSLPAGDILRQMDGIQIIKRFIEHCPRRKLTAQVITVLHNLASNYSVTETLGNAGVVKTLLDIVNGYLTREPGVEVGSDELPHLSLDSDDSLVLARTVMCLTNILYRNVNTKAQFYNNSGIETILGIILRISKKSALYVMSVKLLKVFIGHAYSNSKAATDEPLLPTMELLKLQVQHEAQQNSTDVEISKKKSKLRDAVHIMKGADKDSEDEADHFPTGQPQMSLSPQNQHYVLGQKVDIYDDERHELFPQKRANEINVQVFAQHVCGMLNSGFGGTIYFGIDENSEVFGLELSRDEKDRFRLAVDQHMFNKISPVLLHSQFSIKDIPVVDQKSGDMISGLYVIEVAVKAHRGSIYTTVDGQCYYRFGSDTSAITRQELRELIVLEEEAMYRSQIQRLLDLRDYLLQQSS